MCVFSSPQNLFCLISHKKTNKYLKYRRIYTKINDTDFLRVDLHDIPFLLFVRFLASIIALNIYVNEHSQYRDGEDNTHTIWSMRRVFFFSHLSKYYKRSINKLTLIFLLFETLHLLFQLDAKDGHRKRYNIYIK